jgi:hypothetical protein
MRFRTIVDADSPEWDVSRRASPGLPGMRTLAAWVPAIGFGRHGRLVARIASLLRLGQGILRKWS